MLWASPGTLPYLWLEGTFCVAATSVVQVHRRGCLFMAYLVGSHPTWAMSPDLCPFAKPCVRMILSEICSGSLRLWKAGNGPSQPSTEHALRSLSALTRPFCSRRRLQPHVPAFTPLYLCPPYSLCSEHFPITYPILPDLKGPGETTPVWGLLPSISPFEVPSPLSTHFFK